MPNRNYNTRSIVEAGLISALIVIIMLINAYIPAVAIFGTFILPIPVTVLYIRHGYKVTTVAVIVSTILISMLYDPFSGLTSAIMFGLIGMTLGYCIKHDKKYSFTILLLSIASAVQIVVNFLIFSAFVDKKNLYQTLAMYSDLFKKSLDSAQSIYAKFGISADQIAPMRKALDMFTPEFLMMLVPALIFVSAVVSAYLNYIISAAVLKKLRYKVNSQTPFSEIYVNNRIGTVLILFVLIGMLLNKQKVAAGSYITSSSMLITQYAFLLDGVSLAVYYMKHRFNMQKGLIILIIIFAVFSQVGMMALIFAAVADLILDFRKLDPYRKIRNA
jgi:uncharacterized protein YybS (DUF2232 family)